MSPAFSDELFTTEPPGKPMAFISERKMYLCVGLCFSEGSVCVLFIFLFFFFNASLFVLLCWVSIAAPGFISCSTRDLVP